VSHLRDGFIVAKVGAVILAQSPKVVILAQPESLYWPLPLLLPLFVPTRHSGAARISVLALAVALAVVCSNSSFWRSQNLRIGPCRCSCCCLFQLVILAQPESLYWPLPLLLPLFVPTRHSGAARISVLALAVALAPVFRMEPGASAP
jgi:hypothetical protein